jgi:hypothetical protein
LEILNYRFAYALYQRIFLCPTLFGTRECKDLAFPAHLFQSQTRNFGAAKPVDRKQHQDRPITDVAGPIAIDTSDESLHVRPGRSDRKCLLLEQARPVDAGCHSARTPTLHFSMSEK